MAGYYHILKGQKAWRDVLPQPKLKRVQHYPRTPEQRASEVSALAKRIHDLLMKNGPMFKTDITIEVDARDNDVTDALVKISADVGGSGVMLLGNRGEAKLIVLPAHTRAQVRDAMEQHRQLMLAQQRNKGG